MTQTRTAGPYRSPEPCLLAERTRYARAEGSCGLCGRPIRRGQRVADVVGGRGTAHLPCAAQLAAGEPR